MTDFEDDEDEDSYDPMDYDSNCTCGRYNQCEHKNWMIDRETEVRKVVSKWVEDGSNLFPFGSHGNWIVGAKDDECYWFRPGADENGDQCFNNEFDRTDAAGHQFDSRGFFIDIQPMPKPRIRMPMREASILSTLVNNGLISQPECDAMMDQLRRDYERVRNNLRTASQPQPGRRYVEFPVHVSRSGQGLMQRQEGGGVPYTPDFRDDSGTEALRATLGGEWEPPPVFNITTDERSDEF